MDQRSEAGPQARPGRLRLALALAARAEADSLRARRAERLARIRAGAAPGHGPDAEAGLDPEAPPQAAAAREAGDEPLLPAHDVEVLERFLADLVGTIEIDPAPPQPASTRLAPVLPMARPAAGAPSGGVEDLSRLPGALEDLSRLPGAGPGLVGVLIRGGVPDLVALAGLGRDALADRLGPLGRLIDLDGWLAFARAATGRAEPAVEGPVPRDLAG